MAEKNRNERKKFITLVCIVCALLVSLPFVCCEKPKKVYYEIRTKKLSSPVKIAFLSDVHSSFYGKDMREITDAVEEFRPDAVVFGGDLFDNEWGEKNSLILAEKMSAEYPCYYALGNHEFHADALLVKRKMSELGVNVLDGKYSDLEAPGGTVRFIGIDGAFFAGQLSAAENAVSGECFNILIDHYPSEFEEIKGKGFDLMLSGHAHGGQVRIPFILNGIFSPDEGFFPHYAGGEYSDGENRMIVSRGLCRTLRDIVIPRVFNRPEIVFITVSSNS